MRRRGSYWGRRVVSAVTSLAMVWSLTPAPALAEAGQPPAEAGALEETAGQDGRGVPDPGQPEDNPEQGEADATQAEAGSPGPSAGEAQTDDVPEEPAEGAAAADDASAGDPSELEAEPAVLAPGPTATGPDAPNDELPAGEDAVPDDEAGTAAAPDDEAGLAGDEVDGAEAGSAIAAASGELEADPAASSVAGDSMGVEAGTTEEASAIDAASSVASVERESVEEQEGSLDDRQPPVATQAGAIASGMCGSCPWTIGQDGTLTIGPGTLDGPTGTYGNSWPWLSYTDSIRVVRLEGRVVASTSMHSMFEGCTKIESAYLEGLDTSSVKDMSDMFYSCYTMESLYASDWDTSSVESMACMFYSCFKLNSLNISAWNTSSVKNMRWMFVGCWSMRSFTISGWDTSSVENMDAMFNECRRIRSLDLSYWNTSRVTDMGWMFAGCNDLESLDISGWNTSSVTEYEQMFVNCSDLESLRVGSGYVIKSPDMFPDVTGERGWWSSAEQRWRTKDEVVASRSGVADTYLAVVKISGAEVVLSGTSFTYDGTVKRPEVLSVRMGATTLARGTDYSVSYYDKDSVDAGSYPLYVGGRGGYTGSAIVRYTITRAPNPISAFAKAATQAVAYSSGEAMKVGANINATKAQGAISYTNVSSDSTAKRFVVDRTTGAVTVPKSTAIGTYAVTIEAAAAGNTNYLAGSKTASFKLAVVKAAQSVTASDVFVAVGRTASLGARASGGGRLSYRSSDESVARVDAAGAVTGVRPGRATVTIGAAETANHRGASRSVTVTVTAAPARTFPDVPASHWAHGVVGRAASLDLISGYANGNFGPSDRITRGQVAIILWRMAGKPAARSGARSFPDVGTGASCYRAVRWASSVGVISGYGSGRFGPNDNVTREQLAAMLANYAKKVAGRAVSGSAKDYASMRDAARVGRSFRSVLGWCYRNGLMSGTSDGRIDPKGNATRAQAAKMIVGLHDLVS